MGTEQFEKWSFSMFSHRKIHAFGCNGNKKMTVSYLSSFTPAGTISSAKQTILPMSVRHWRSSLKNSKLFPNLLSSAKSVPPPFKMTTAAAAGVKNISQDCLKKSSKEYLKSTVTQGLHSGFSVMQKLILKLNIISEDLAVSTTKGCSMNTVFQKFPGVISIVCSKKEVL